MFVLFVEAGKPEIRQKNLGARRWEPPTISTQLSHIHDGGFGIFRTRGTMVKGRYITVLCQPCFPCWEGGGYSPLVGLNRDVSLNRIWFSQVFCPENGIQCNYLSARRVSFRIWGPFLETPDNFPGPTSYFFKLIYLSGNGNYWRKLSDMLHEIIKIKFSFQNE